MGLDVLEVDCLLVDDEGLDGREQDCLKFYGLKEVLDGLVQDCLNLYG